MHCSVYSLCSLIRMSALCEIRIKIGFNWAAKLTHLETTSMLTMRLSENRTEDILF